ncbi:hypothetical protein HX821_11615 [Pseudomonas sp. B6001]|nr:hypothetical protein [Pseudomonas sp. B6001]
MESEEIEDLTTGVIDKKLLTEISTWKREAKSENNDRYFYHVKEVDQIAKGDKYFIIGRKGSGKTAISEFFNRQSKYNVFSEKLSFKNFPFNELYSRNNKKYTAPNEFISIWKYLIYSTICRLMLKNQSIDPEIRKELETIYGDDTPLNRRVGRWVNKEFGLSLFGLSLKVARQHSVPQEEWTQNVDYLEDVIAKYAGDSTYYVLFDELDEDYRDIVEQEQYKQYKSLITSLFKAVQDVRSSLSAQGATKVFPVIFLRDDIYEIVQDSDKNKWGDFRLDLNWDVDKIKKVMAFRISRAIDPLGKHPLPFDIAWSKVFGEKKIGVGTKRDKNKITTFDFIARSTFLRPRDFVSYLQNCAQQALEEGKSITPLVVRRVDKAFSNYLRDELTDELFAILPDISRTFDVISQLRKWIFSIQEFESVYSDHVRRGIIQGNDVTFVLQVLFLFSVIGNTPQTGRYFFRYQNKEARLNYNERVVVHRGLFKALQIL